MSYLPIENYGIIGNLHTAALVGTNGSIDWLCFPDFDSPSVFGAILDDAKGGRFQIAPSREGATPKQVYLPETNVLVTRFLSPDGVGEVIDFMPVPADVKEEDHHQLIRRVKVVRGAMAFRVQCRPAFDYARATHETDVLSDGAVFRSHNLSLGLATRVPLILDGDGVVADFTLREGETTSFVLQGAPPEGGCGACAPEEQQEEAFLSTMDYWRRWIGKSNYRGRWREMVDRSALTLKLLTYRPTGAIVAAPTCSLPEGIGSERNWDYRYTWIRDAAFTLYGLMRIGLTDEAHRFMDWLQARAHELSPDGSLQVMYGIDGRHTLTEETLDHLEGYRGSRPVRIGNGAYSQLQLDIYGELMDSVYLFNKYGTPISYDFWVNLRRLLNWLCDNWQQPDEGIWEVRGGQQHFVYSKLMCWVALDRGLRLAHKRSFPADRDRWETTRDQIYEEIMDKGWNDKRQAFVQSYGSEHLDASNLMMPLVFFLSPTDPRMLATLDATMRELVSDSLVYRYNVDDTDDGLKGDEGTFSICTFWLVEALTRAGRVGEARLIFEKMLGYANHLGLYAEQIGPTGEALGNFPQAFTHLALISAAYNLDKALGERG
ncbi:glycoside hydrolase family 15 protein [Nitrospinae bacterium AH_259_B05_G02_I21]|nr:glycoside hydrolase family 15 protein [Nitrospinae bacterium AH_259_B05_G02_I21]MDA2932282.1 glycoside hydrolase family 15 protein [Nitrospinae bacterium AH-259-F20]